MTTAPAINCWGGWSTNVFSLLDGFKSPEEHVKVAQKLGFKNFGISDHGTVSGCFKHLEACKKYGIKPILGNEIYCCLDLSNRKSPENRGLVHQVVWAKNKQGWQDLIKLTSHTNHEDRFYYKPRISIEELEQFTKNGNLQSFSGHQGSMLSDNLFCDLSGCPTERKARIKEAYNSSKKEKDPEFYRQFLKDDWLESTCELAIKLQKIFGKDNFFIELQNEFNPDDILPCTIHPIIVECLRKVSIQTEIPAIASSDPHYPEKKDAEDQRILVMINMRETEAGIKKKLEKTEETDLLAFFGNDSFYIHSYEEMAQKFTEQELSLTNDIADQIEQYELKQKPQLPKYVVQDIKFDDLEGNEFLSECKTEQDKLLLKLCIDGAKKKEPWKISGIAKEKYWERVKEELKIYFEADLANYFLIVYDIVQYAKNKPTSDSFDWQKNIRDDGDIDPIAVGWGRGSVGGCITAYLLDITDVDPILYGLSSARFYNPGRNTKDYVSLPDIDIDFDSKHRDKIFEYIAWKYGKQSLGKMVTLGKLRGRGALKDLLRVKGVDFDIANQITKHVPDEAAIADQIQEMHDDGYEDYGIIDWSIEHSKDFKQYYDNEKYKSIIDQARRLENTCKSAGIHPAGVVIMPINIEDTFPMMRDTKGKELIIAFDMKDTEKCGGIKIDILSISLLTKLKYCEDIINEKV